MTELILQMCQIRSCRGKETDLRFLQTKAAWNWLHKPFDFKPHLTIIGACVCSSLMLCLNKAVSLCKCDSVVIRSGCKCPHICNLRHVSSAQLRYKNGFIAYLYCFNNNIRKKAYSKHNILNVDMLKDIQQALLTYRYYIQFHQIPICRVS